MNLAWERRRPRRRDAGAPSVCPAGSWSLCTAARPRRLSMNHSSQIRMTNDEIQRNDKFRMTKSANARLRVFRHSGFGFLSSFVIQRRVRLRFMVPMHAQKRLEALHEPERRAPARRGQARPERADREIGAPG